MTTSSLAPKPFELLELPDGRCYVAKPAAAAAALVAGSFARLDPPSEDEGAGDARTDPVGVYASRDEAELAILRASPTLHVVEPLSTFAPWLRQNR
jgi:hypothetical protein